jgi:Cu/Ag efflux protein CusF
LRARRAGYSTAADSQSHSTASAQATAGACTEGEIKKIDIEQGKVTLKHGAIENLGMPSMTMVFGSPTLHS